MLAFSLCYAPATFAKLMDAILTSLTWEACFAYLDDTIVFKRTWEEHISCLRGVLQRIGEAGLKHKPSTCTLARPSVEFLGHIISQHRLTPFPSKGRSPKQYSTAHQRYRSHVFHWTRIILKEIREEFCQISTTLSPENAQYGQEFKWTPKYQQLLKSYDSASPPPLW